jgi:hypothetical protein
MYITELPDIDIEGCQKKKSKECHYCQSQINLSDAIIDNNKTIISACFMCRAVVNYKKEYAFMGVLCHTELSQLEIIKATWKFVKTNGYVPLPTEIDPNAKLVSLSVLMFAKFEKKKKFPYYCLFFTNNILNMITDEIDNIFNSKDKNILNYFNIPKYNMTEDEKIRADKECLKIRQKNYEIMVPIENELLCRYQKLF